MALKKKNERFKPHYIQEKMFKLHGVKEKIKHLGHTMQKKILI